MAESDIITVQQSKKGTKENSNWSKKGERKETRTDTTHITQRTGAYSARNVKFGSRQKIEKNCNTRRFDFHRIFTFRIVVQLFNAINNQQKLEQEAEEKKEAALANPTVEGMRTQRSPHFGRENDEKQIFGTAKNI